MSIRVPLQVLNLPNPPLAQQGIPVITTRLRVAAAFLDVAGQRTRPEWAIVDTGAPVSLLPYQVWRACAVERVGDLVVRGIVPRPECQMSVDVGRLTCLLLAEGGAALELPIYAFLAPSDDVALLLGVEGILNRMRLVVDCSAQSGYLEWNAIDG